MNPGTDYDPHEAILRVWSDSDWAGDAKDKKSQSNLKTEVDGARCISHHANRKHVRTRVAKLSIMLQQRPPVRHVDRRNLFVHGTGTNSCWTVPPHVAYADVKVWESHVICQRKFFGYSSWYNRGVVTVGARSSAENRADLGTKPLLAHRLQQLRQWNGLVLDRNEKIDDWCQDENEQREKQVRIISDPGQSDGGVLDALT